MAGRSAHRVTKAAPRAVNTRRSTRLAEQWVRRNEGDLHQQRQLVSPSLSPASSPVQPECTRKRKQSESEDNTERTLDKRLRRAGETSQGPLQPSIDPVAYWATTWEWPEDMAQRRGRPSLPNSKRNSSSTSFSERQQRLEQNGIHMRRSMLLRPESKRSCDELLDGSHEPTYCPSYPVDKIDDVLDRVGRLNETRLQRDITPWVVPSPENLYFSGYTSLDYLGEELNAEWIRCEPMGSTRPKPDLTVGLQRTAFEAAELEKLENYGTPRRPFCFTSDLCFPFLVCEAKTGRVGIDLADTQNIHSASMAVRALLDLYVASYGKAHEKTRDLLGRVLVFSVSHTNRQVNLYGHYAVANDIEDGSISGGTDSGFQYYRYDIAMFSLNLFNARDRFKAYNFVRNVYEKFAPQHLQRIRAAVGYMQPPQSRTGLSFSASDLALEDGDLSQTPEVLTAFDKDGFRTPSEPASASQRRETSRLKSQLDELVQQLQEQRKESREKEERMVQQMEQQRKESKEQMDQQRTESKEQMDQQRKESKEQMDQQRKESKEKEDRMVQQMEQQQEQNQKQIALLERLLDYRRDA